MIEVKFTIAGAPYENIKVTVRGADSFEIERAMQDVARSAPRFFSTYEKLIQVRDSGHREAVNTVLAELPGAVVETETVNVDSEGPFNQNGNPTIQPFWDRDPNPLPHTKPWERTSVPSSTTQAAPGQTVNLL